MASLNASNAYLNASAPNGVVPDEPSPYGASRRIRGNHPFGPRLAVKRIQLRWDDEKGKYVASDDIEESLEGKKEEEQETYAFSIIRQFRPSEREGLHSVGEEIQVDSPPFIRAAKEVMKGRRDIAWEAKPLKFHPDELLAFAPQFNTHLEQLKNSMQKTPDEVEEMEHVGFFVEFMDKEYRERLQELESLVTANQITFNTLWAVLIPGMDLVTRCTMTNQPWVLRLLSLEIQDKTDSDPRRWVLQCEYIDTGKGVAGWAKSDLIIPQFFGAKRITELVAYPFERAPDREKMTATLIDRGKRRWALRDWSHKWYNDIAYAVQERGDHRKFFTKSRIILDGEMYDRYSPYDYTPPLVQNLDHDVVGAESTRPLEDNDYLLMSPKLHGYALSDREWLIFSVDGVKDIEWSSAAFDTLDMMAENKELVRSLVAQHKARLDEQDEEQDSKKEEAEHKEMTKRAGDFVYGKGTGLLFNLHGPPGVGKTLTAEAISEVSQSPLYVVGSGELGTNAGELDRSLARVFTLATRWKAVVLIDEADVYLEKRDFNDMHRNAMVAVFLRKVEYYPGILFLTTNRVKVLDEAMKSRIDVSLFYAHPDIPARERLWATFLQATDMTAAERSRLNSEMRSLRHLSLNGREIKNVIKVASAFARHGKRPLSVDDILRVVRFSQQSQGSEERKERFWSADWLWHPDPRVAGGVAAGALAVLLGGVSAYLRLQRR
ncbi:P-loop containing nucleoside triphosphate hydrolase protein [Dentipellis sp. KUC8613]|nr:P-loop containing nucleoside triphosphate hydrolase protein [Dentipellis sp. KUC8613]